MRIAVSGSIANDYLMSFPGRFRDQFVSDQLDNVSLSFLVDALEVRRGGVAANICYGMGKLGLRPLLVGAVGHDFFSEYEPHLAAAGVDTSAVYVSQERRTAMFLCTSDEEENQIASFCPGAMTESQAIDLDALPGDPPPPDLVLVCPNDPETMIAHTRQALAAGRALAADPSQQLPRMDGEQVRALIDGATYLLTNDYEAALVSEKTGWSSDEILEHVDMRITTHGNQGCVIEQADGPSLKIPCVPTRDGVTLEPTGIGDAFRAGFFSGLSMELDLERCAQLGSAVATCTLETVGPQDYDVDPGSILPRVAQVYGDDAAADLEPILIACAAQGTSTDPHTSQEQSDGQDRGTSGEGPDALVRVLPAEDRGRSYSAASDGR